MYFHLNFGVIKRSLTLLDSDGNTSIPGALSVSGDLYVKGTKLDVSGISNVAKITREMRLYSGVDTVIPNLRFRLHLYPNYWYDVSTDSRSNSIYFYADWFPINIRGQFRFTGLFNYIGDGFASQKQTMTIIINTPITGSREVDGYELAYVSRASWYIIDYCNEPDEAKNGHPSAYIHLGAIRDGFVNGTPNGWASESYCADGSEGGFTLTWTPLK